MTARFRFIVTTPISRPFAQVTKLGLTTRTAALAPPTPPDADCGNTAVSLRLLPERMRQDLAQTRSLVT